MPQSVRNTPRVDTNPSPFLTLEDPNAKVKGSRDPLGLQPIWAAFGRRIVVNLTTQSTSVRGFTVLLLGRWLAERLIADGTLPSDEALNVFLRMEQLGAHVRQVAHGVEGEIRGIERVKANLAETNNHPHIGTDRRALILSDQKTYGLWGLYTVPARRSGWLPDGSVGITDQARTFLQEHYQLGRAQRPLERLVAHGGRLHTRGKGDQVFQALAELLDPDFTPAEQAFYGQHLRDAGPLQTELRQLFETHTQLDEAVGREEATLLQETTTNEALGRALHRIQTVEAFLAPAAVLFDYILTQTGQPIATVADRIAELWPDPIPNLDRTAFADLTGEITQVTSKPIAQAIDAAHEALARSDFPQAITTLVDLNRLVMQDRKAGPWVRTNGTLEVRYRGQEHLMPTADELPTLWRNSYFLDALKSVTRQLRRKRR